MRYVKEFNQFNESKDDELNCIECGTHLHYDSDNDGDTETMGGHSVEYYICPNCNTKHQYILDSLDGNSLSLDF